MTEHRRDEDGNCDCNDCVREAAEAERDEWEVGRQAALADRWREAPGGTDYESGAP